MSILIKGMEMPKNCFDCPINCRMPDYTLLCRLDFRPRDALLRNDCPLIELRPHGRLIDADALMLKIQEYIEEYSDIDENGVHDPKWCAMKEAEMVIYKAPTIIPAEVEESPIITKASTASRGIYEKEET